MKFVVSAIYIKEKKINGRLEKKKVQVPHENFTVYELWFNTECTVLNHYSVIATFYCVSITIYIKGRKSIDGRLEKKNVATLPIAPLETVATVQNL